VRLVGSLGSNHRSNTMSGIKDLEYEFITSPRGRKLIWIKRQVYLDAGTPTLISSGAGLPTLLSRCQEEQVGVAITLHSIGISLCFVWELLIDSADDDQKRNFGNGSILLFDSVGPHLGIVVSAVI
jgi:hypothetical protein